MLPPDYRDREARGMAAQNRRLAAIAKAAAQTLREVPYHVVRAKDVAAAVRLPREAGHSAGRSAVWLHNEVRNRRVLVGLAALHAWRDFLTRADWAAPQRVASVTAAREIVAHAMAVVVRFHRAEAMLMTQVGYGIGDIATAEKRQLAAGVAAVPPVWPASQWGRVAAAAWDGRCVVFADFLQPVLWQCVQSVTYVSDASALASASRLSDIAFRTCLADPKGPVDRLAHGLAGLWFELDLIPLAGSLPRNLESNEVAFATTARRGTDPQAEASALAGVIRVLLEAGTLHARCADECQHALGLLRNLVEAPTAQAGAAKSAPYDFERMSDTATHLGLAALRYGDTRLAEQAWQLSRDVAEDKLGRDVSRIARADNNLAALAAEIGRPAEAWTQIQQVFQARTVLLDKAPDDPAAWRRLSTTARTRAEIARRAGRVIDAVQLAADLLADRRGRRPAPEDPDVADALLLLGQALLVGGHPAEARHHIERAAATRRRLFVQTSYRVQEDVVWLARTALAGEYPGTAADLLAGQAAITTWFCERVSFRLGYAARRLLALARARLADIEPAEAALRSDRDGLVRLSINAAADPLAHDYARAIGEVRLLAGDPNGAVRLLDQLATAEARPGAATPAHGWTLVLLGRAADKLGDSRRGEECFRRVSNLADSGVDPRHPVMLAARYDEAARRAAIGESIRAGELLAPLLDRRQLGHGRPALGEDHPLLGMARDLADRLGIAVASTAAMPSGTPLDSGVDL